VYGLPGSNAMPEMLREGDAMSRKSHWERNAKFDKEVFPKIQAFCDANKLRITEYGVGHFRVFGKSGLKFDFWKSGTHGMVHTSDYPRFDTPGIFIQLKELAQYKEPSKDFQMAHRNFLSKLAVQINGKRV
jgi:hypothetical protein